MVLAQMHMIGDFLPGEVFTEMGENVFSGLLGVVLTFAPLFQIAGQCGNGAEDPCEGIGDGVRGVPKAPGVFAAVK